MIMCSHVTFVSDHIQNGSHPLSTLYTEILCGRKKKDRNDMPPFYLTTENQEPPVSVFLQKIQMYKKITTLTFESMMIAISGDLMIINSI